MLVVGLGVTFLMLMSVGFESRLGYVFPSLVPQSKKALWVLSSIGIVLVASDLFSDLFQGQLTWYKLAFFLALVPALVGVTRNKFLANREQQPAEAYMESRNRSYRFFYHVCWHYSVFYIMAATLMLAVTNSPLVE